MTGLRRPLLQSALIVAVAASLAVYWLPLPALALAVGGLCGILNAMLTARGIERLGKSRSAGGFVISSFSRLALFGIVPVAFAASGPWWSMVWYFAGFFFPTALYAASVARLS